MCWTVKFFKPSNHLMAEDRDSFPRMEGQKDQKRPKILYYISKEENLVKKPVSICRNID